MRKKFSLSAAKALGFGEEALQGFRVLVSVAQVCFDGITQAGVTGGNKECRCDIGLGISLRRVGFGAPLVQLVDVSIASVTLAQEVGTDEHECGEAMQVVGGVHMDVAIGEDAVERRGFVVVPQGLDHLILEVVQQVATQQTLTVGVIDGDLPFLDIREGDADDAAHQVHAHRQVGTSVTQRDI